MPKLPVIDLLLIINIFLSRLLLIYAQNVTNETVLMDDQLLNSQNENDTTTDMSVFMSSTPTPLISLLSLDTSDSLSTSTTTAQISTTTTPAQTTTQTPPPLNQNALSPFFVKTQIKVNLNDNIKAANFITQLEQKLLQVFDEGNKILIQQSGQTSRRRRTATRGQHTLTITSTERTNPNDVLSRTTDVVYYVTTNSQPVKASVVIASITKLDNQRIAILLGYEIVNAAIYNNPAVQKPQNDEKIWIVGAVLGALIGAILIVWIVLFIYGHCIRPINPLRSQSLSVDQFNSKNNKMAISEKTNSTALPNQNFAVHSNQSHQTNYGNIDINYLSGEVAKQIIQQTFYIKPNKENDASSTWAVKRDSYEHNFKVPPLNLTGNYSARSDEMMSESKIDHNYASNLNNLQRGIDQNQNSIINSERNKTTFGNQQMVAVEESDRESKDFKNSNQENLILAKNASNVFSSPTHEVINVRNGDLDTPRHEDVAFEIKTQKGYENEAFDRSSPNSNNKIDNEDDEELVPISDTIYLESMRQRQLKVPLKSSLKQKGGSLTNNQTNYPSNSLKLSNMRINENFRNPNRPEDSDSHQHYHDGDLIPMKESKTKHVLIRTPSEDQSNNTQH